METQATRLRKSFVLTLLVFVAAAGSLSSPREAGGDEPVTGSLAPNETQTFALPVSQEDTISAQLTWVEAYVLRTSSDPITIQGGSFAIKDVTLDTPSDISAGVSWDGTSKGHAVIGEVSFGNWSDYPITVTSGGKISFTLLWPYSSPNPNLDLFLLDSFGLIVANSNQTNGNSETINYDVRERGAAFSDIYTVRVVATGQGSTYDLSGSYPVTANVDLQLESGDGDLLATSTETSRRRRSLTYLGAGAGSYRFLISSYDEPVTVIFSETHLVPSRAPVSLELLGPSGLLKTVTSDTGAIELSHQVEPGQQYWLRVQNESFNTPVPSFALSWSTAEKLTTLIDVTSGNISERTSIEREIEITEIGDITAELDWGRSNTTRTWQRSVGTLSTWQTIITAGAFGNIEATITWPAGIFNPDLDLYLIDLNSGATLAFSESLIGNSESISFQVSDLAHPAERDYILRVRAKTLGSTFNLSSTLPVTANLNLEMRNSSGEKIASSYSRINKPEVLVAKSQPPGTYSLRVMSFNYSAGYTMETSWSH